MKTSDSEFSFEKFFQYSNDLLCIADKNGNFIKLNPQWERTLGYSQAEMEGKPFLDFIHPDDIQQTNIVYNEQSVSKELTDFTNRYRHKNGTYRWLAWRSYPVGEYIYGSARDITQQKESEEVLKKSENKYRSLFQNMTSAFALLKLSYDEDGNPTVYRFVEVNPAFEKFTGIKASQIIGKTGKEVLPETEEHWIQTYDHDAKPGLSLSYINFSKEFDKHFETYTFCPEQDYFALVFNDITERVKNEDNLNMFKVSSEKSKDAVYWFTPDAEFVYANKSACDMLGYSKEELLNMRVFDIDKNYPEEEWHRQWDIYRTSKQERSIHVETIHTRKDGTLVFVDVVTTFLSINGVEYQIANGRDMTANKRKEIELNKFKLSIDNALDAVYWINGDGGFDYVNEQACSMLGYTYEELTHLNISDLDPSYTLEFHKEKWKALCKQKMIDQTNFETVHTKKDGTLLPVEISVIFIWLNEKGFLITYCKDISERKKQEEILLKNQQALIESEEKARLFIENTPLPIAMFDRNMRYMMASKRWCIDYKLGDIAIIGRSHYEVFPEIGDNWKNDHQRVLQGEIYRNNKDKFIREDGSVQWLRYELHPWYKNKDNIGGLVMFTEDITERVEAEEALKASQQKIESLIKVVPAGIGIAYDRVFWEVNPQFCKITGYTKDELIGRDSKIFYANPEEFKRVGDALEEGLTNAGTTSVETIWERKDGEIRNVFVAWTPIDKNDHSKGITFAVQDITEHKLNEEKIKADEVRFRALADNVPGAIYMCENDADYTMLYLNDVVKQITGYDKEVFLNGKLHFSDLYHPDDAKLILPIIDDAIINKHQFELLYRIKHKSGGWRWIHEFGTGIYNENNLDYLIGFFLDETERKQAESEILLAKERAEESEFFLKESQRTGNIGSYKMSFETGVWLSTEVLDTIFGVDDTYNKDTSGWLALVHPDDKEMMAGYFQHEVIEKKQRFNKEYRIVRKNDSVTRWVRGLGNLYFDINGNLSHMLGTITDVTDKKLIEEERRMMNIHLENKVIERTNQLQQVNKDLEAFVYSVSHDLRAPVRHIDGFIHLLEQAINPMNDKVLNYIHKISLSSRNMSTMIDELLQFSRLGRKEINTRSVNLPAIIDEVISQFKPDYETRMIKWNIHKLPIINGDPALLRIAFMNLISNAIKYTAKKEQAIIEIGQKNDMESETVCIFIKDNGAGFDMNYKEKLFGVFQRLHKNEEFEGVGIGLANVKQIINKHHGQIEAVSEMNKGATFYITLPKKE